MLRIYIDGETYNDHRMFFDMNGDDYDIVNEYPFDFSIGWVNGDNKKLSTTLFHNVENQSSDFGNWLEDDNVYILTNVYDPTYVNNPRVIYTDFLFNRTKAYYQRFQFDKKTIKWYFSGDNSYIIPNDDVDNKTKIFVSPNGIVVPGDGISVMNVREQKYKHKFNDFLKKYDNLGHLNNPYLFSHLDLPFTSNINEVLSYVKPKKYIRRGYSPAHNAYYEDTFIHLCVETIEHGVSIAPTEKTYDPLIKGHFVLPFSTKGIISFLKSKGFEFPNFIDYSYDDESNDGIRFEKYISEIERLLSMNITQWKKHWQENRHIRLHNQQIFFANDFDKVNLKKIMNL
jgi:hypothetical protein